MSIDMYLGSSKAQGSSASALSQNYQAGFQALQAAVGQFTQDTLLKSQAYDSGKSYFQGVYIPLIQGAILVAEATGKAVEKLPNDYASQVDSCDLRSSELEAEIQRYETQIQGMKNQMDQIKQLLPVSSERVQHLREASGLISDYTSAKRKLEKQLQKLLAFHAFSSTLFTEVTCLQTAVNQGLAQVSGGKGFDPKTGTFSPKNLKDTRWMITIGNAWEKREKEIAEINRKARVEREIAALKRAVEVAGADIAMNSFMMNVGLMNMGPSIYGNLKDYGSQKALTTSLRPTGTISRSNTKVSGTNGVLSGSKNGKNYVLDRSRSTGNTTYKKASGANQKVIEEITNPVLEAPRSGSGLKVDDIKPVKGKGSVYEIDPLTGKAPTKQTQIIVDEFPNVPKAHGFSDIIDNYAGLADVTDLGNAKLYQIQGSQNGVMGRFEWIIQDGKVTHRMFVGNPELNGVPIK